MNPVPSYLENALDIIKFLQAKGIDPIFYGSLGASLYLGRFKTFNDVDLLVKNSWVNVHWPELVALMKQKGFILVDEHEHEFKGSDGTLVAFAEETVLMRDNVLASLEEVITKRLGSTTIRTLSPEGFIAAYTFSEKDGYRKNTRGKKDRLVIELLRQYLASAAERPAA